MIDPHESRAMRSMWASVVLAVLDDANREYCRAISRGQSTAPVLREVRHYFDSRDGRSVCALSGVDVSPDRAVSTISVPRRAFKDLLKRIVTAAGDRA